MAVAADPPAARAYRPRVDRDASPAAGHQPAGPPYAAAAHAAQHAYATMSAALQHILLWWRILPPWLRKPVAAASIITLAKITIQIAIQIRPRITPPGAGFILHSAARRRYRNFDRTLRPL